MTDDVKMDWNEFIVQKSEEFDMDLSEWAPLTRNAIVGFDYDDNGNISGKHNGRMVYRDSSTERKILAGETWIVQLTLNPKTGTNYFAKAVRRIDASFLFELNREQRDEIAEAVWSRHRQELEPDMRKLYENRTQLRIANEVYKVNQAHEEEKELMRADIDDLKKSVDEAEARVSELSADLEAALAAKAALEKDLEGRDALIEKLKSSPAPEAAAAKPSKSSKSKKKAEADPDEWNGGKGMVGMLPYTVTRTGPDTLWSDMFGNKLYKVRISKDGKNMVMRHEKNHGNVACRDGVMCLEGLGAISPWNGKEEQYETVRDPKGYITFRLDQPVS